MTSDAGRRKPTSALGCAHRVLVLDDDATSRKITTYVLEEAGHVCEAVATARAALSSIDTFAPEVVLYEWDLRGDAGAGLAGRLRARSRVLKRPLIVIAVSVLDEPAGFRSREAVDGYITKPLDIRALARSITEM